MYRLAVAVVLLFTLALPAMAAQRLALVIGIDNYDHVTPLQKARSDARAVSATLASVGFDVDTVLDATRRDMNLAIARFTARLEPGDTALVFYAGHGVEIAGENYLLPRDIEATGATAEEFVRYESVALSELMFRVQSSGARTTLMFIDACRDNPFAATTGRSIGSARGLARIAAPEGSFVVFSAGARQQALDRLDDADQNENSVFTRLLLPKLEKPGLELRDMIAELRVEVRDLARTRDHAQFPAYYDELLGEFYFAASSGSVPAGEDAAADPAPAVGVGDMRADFELARSIGTEAAWEAFLETYGGQDTLPVRLAEDALRGLRLAPGPDTDPEPSAAEAPEVAAAPPPQDLAAARLERVRAAQAALNARGCNAGGADGIVGARTLAALDAFVRASGKSLARSDLGTQHAVDVISSTSGRVCPVAAPVTPQPAGPAPLDGNWSFSANCPLFITATGVITYRRTGTNTYRVTARNSLGYTGAGNVQETNGTLRGTMSWSNGVSETYTSRLTADRRGYSGTSSLGCSFTARKTG